MDGEDTIAAVATPVGIGGIGIIRVSGSLSRRVAERIFRKRNVLNLHLRPYHLHLGDIISPCSQEVIDEVLLAYMPGPRSYTREDIIEIQCHSGYVVVEKILSLIVSQEGVRPAEPGEFTRRAFLNGRLDLTQVEAIIDLISARTGAALRQATEQLGGALNEKILDFRRKLTMVIANIESAIDFPEEDIEVFSPEEIVGSLEGVKEELNGLLSTYDEGRVFREGLKTAIIGRPNVGKSSLLNALLEEDRVIVSHVPGTTRDTIEESVNIHGIPITVVDTAGLPFYPTSDPVEQKGIERARAKTSQADLVLFVLDRSLPLTDNDRALFKEFERKRLVIVLNKADLPAKLDPSAFPEHLRDSPIIEVSAKYHEGINELRTAIYELITYRWEVSAAPVFINRLRHRVSLEEAVEGLDQAIESMNNRVSLEFVAPDVKRSLAILGELVGETTSEEILDHIFSEFCIGK